MSVLIADARQDFIHEVGDDAKFVFEIIYADDTLIVDERGDLAGIHMKWILKQVEHYVLTFNWDKLAMICISCNPIIAKLSICNITCCQSIVYLGGVIAANGDNTSEINRSIGLANSDVVSL